MSTQTVCDACGKVMERPGFRLFLPSSETYRDLCSWQCVANLAEAPYSDADVRCRAAALLEGDS